jgi:hypothetical protein
MSRIERLREYQNPQHGPHGQSRDKENLNYWSGRASENSDGADHRATGTEVAQAHSTGKKPVDRPTEMSPRTSRKVDAAMAGMNDLNHVGGSDYMKSIRRDA